MNCSRNRPSLSRAAADCFCTLASDSIREATLEGAFFLAGEAAGYMTGQTVYVHGG
ncbi:hypothetical protein STHU_34420 [Allostella humosa]|nr:hypothetical protein STHU_34420 [Stella humosa]